LKPGYYLLSCRLRSCKIRGAGSMSHENSQFDIPAIQLRESKTQPRVSLSREIGEAQITHTIFGKAKVRIIRKGDQARRILILAAIAVAAITAAAWQGWFAPQQTEPERGMAPAPAASVEAQVNVPTPQPESIALPVAPPLVKSEPVMPPATGISPPVANQEIVPQQPGNLKEAEHKTVVPARTQLKPLPIKPKPVPAEPLMAGKPRPSAVANKDALTNRADIPPAVAIPAQPAASSPAAVVPLGKDDITIQSPVGDKQLSDPINAPGK
jgi:hypothetical protein